MTSDHSFLAPLREDAFLPSCCEKIQAPEHNEGSWRRQAKRLTPPSAHLILHDSEHGLRAALVENRRELPPARRLLERRSWIRPPTPAPFAALADARIQDRVSASGAAVGGNVRYGWDCERGSIGCCPNSLFPEADCFWSVAVRFQPHSGRNCLLDQQVASIHYKNARWERFHDMLYVVSLKVVNQSASLERAISRKSPALGESRRISCRNLRLSVLVECAATTWLRPKKERTRCAEMGSPRRNQCAVL